MSRIRLAIGFCLAAQVLFADGGTVQFRKQAGPFTVTVFSAPVPLRVGPADLSVMVQKTDDRTDVLNCGVVLQLSKSGEPGIQAIATRAQATNKLLYAAPIVFLSAGSWHLTVDIEARGNTVRAIGDVTVLPRLPPLIAYWSYLALFPVAVALFALNQWLKARRRVRNPRVRP